MKMAIPYPSEILGPYVFEPIGEFLAYFGPTVLFPLAHWAAWITITLCVMAILKTIWWDISTGGRQNRIQAAIARKHQEQERQRLLRERSGGISG